MKLSELSTLHKHKTGSSYTECGKDVNEVESSPINVKLNDEVVCDECWDTYNSILAYE